MTIEQIAHLSQVSLQYVLDLIALGTIEPPDDGRDYSDQLAPRVVTALKIRRARLVAGTNEKYLRINREDQS